MHDLGIAMYRQRMRREHPGASEQEIDDLVWEWRRTPPRDTRILSRPKERPDDSR